ncbi:hypothetical protein [Massilia consociata]|uniref:Meckel syndrome type 1 protein n=1 Tax=Massilia consociata TaxID=760117 RepID=A0ABV6FH89_9BURK
MRPNLMSPRRTSGEDSILAMLEREPGRRHGAAASPARLAWYGAGAAVALALTATLVWLASNNNDLRPEVEQSVLADAIHAPPANPAHPAPAGAMRSDSASPAAPPAAPLRQVAMAAPPGSPAADGPAPTQHASAVIVDQPAAPDGVPPLRLLKPAQAQPAPTVPVREPAPVAENAARLAERTAPAAARATATARTGARQASVTPARPAAAPARQAALARSAARPAPARAQRPGSPRKTSDGHVDADVALISAVIVHANGHAPEDSQMTELLCPNDSCKAAPARQ